MPPGGICHCSLWPCPKERGPRGITLKLADRLIIFYGSTIRQATEVVLRSLEYTDGMDGWMGGWSGWVGGVMDGWMDGWTKDLKVIVHLQIHVLSK